MKAACYQITLSKSFPSYCKLPTALCRAAAWSARQSHLINRAKRRESWPLHRGKIPERRLVQVSCSCYIDHDTFTAALNAGDPCNWLPLCPRRQEAAACPQPLPHGASLMPAFLSPGLIINERLARSPDSVAFQPASHQVWQQLLEGRSPSCSCSHLLGWGSSTPPSSPAMQGTTKADGTDRQLLDLLPMA